MITITFDSKHSICEKNQQCSVQKYLLSLFPDTDFPY